jgi:hypothetical protein
MAYQVEKPAVGNAKASLTTPTPPTPAPIKEAVPPYELGNRLDTGRGMGYGRNQSLAPSSLRPGETTSSDFDISPKGGDPVKDMVQSRGLRADENSAVASQLREMSNSPYPTSFGHRNPNAAPNKVPGSIDKNATENPVRKPGA